MATIQNEMKPSVKVETSSPSPRTVNRRRQREAIATPGADKAGADDLVPYSTHPYRARIRSDRNAMLMELSWIHGMIDR